jgi:hypothetical protein
MTRSRRRLAIVLRGLGLLSALSALYVLIVGVKFAIGLGIPSLVLAALVSAIISGTVAYVLFALARQQLTGRLHDAPGPVP